MPQQKQQTNCFNVNEIVALNELETSIALGNIM